jgi:hypothetical protein
VAGDGEAGAGFERSIVKVVMAFDVDELEQTAMVDDGQTAIAEVACGFLGDGVNVKREPEEGDVHFIFVGHITEEDSVVVAYPAQPSLEGDDGVGLPLGEFPEIIFSSGQDWHTMGLPFAVAKLNIGGGGTQQGDVNTGLKAATASGA